MTTELILLGTAGAPLPVACRAESHRRWSLTDGLRHRLWSRVAVRLRRRGTRLPRLKAVFLSHLHIDHIGDLPGMLLYPWGVRMGDNDPLPPVRVYGPPPPEALPADDATFHRETTIHPELPAPGATDLGPQHPGRLRLPSERHAA